MPIFWQVDLRGMEVPDAEESWAGFDIPVLLLTSLPVCQVCGIACE